MLFLKAYFLVFKSTDVDSIRTQFRTELRHTSFLILRILFDKGVDVRACLCFRVASTGIKRLKAWRAIIYSHAERFSVCIPNGSVDSVRRRGTHVKTTDAWARMCIYYGNLTESGLYVNTFCLLCETRNSPFERQKGAHVYWRIST